MKIDSKGRVLSFSEKPKGDDLRAMVNFCCLNFEHKKIKSYYASDLTIYFRQLTQQYWGSQRMRLKRSRTLLQWECMSSRRIYF